MVMIGGIISTRFAGEPDDGDADRALTSEYEVVVVPATSPIKTMADLVRRSRPIRARCPGAVDRPAGPYRILDRIDRQGDRRRDSTKINYVPFKGGGEAIAAIVGGHVTAGVSGLGEFSEQIKGGRMRALAMSSTHREEGIPTLKEQGIDVELGNWRGVFGAPGITTAQRDALVKLVQNATERRRGRRRWGRLGRAPASSRDDQQDLPRRGREADHRDHRTRSGIKKKRRPHAYRGGARRGGSVDRSCARSA